jgi:hypothetical protein
MYGPATKKVLMFEDRAGEMIPVEFEIGQIEIVEET